jgi:hypothetical protein
MEKLGADDLMPAFMYSLVKANVPNLYSELQFLNEFVVERNYSSDQFNHYLMTRKRMSDLEAALHFIDSIDMNVRDEKNALVPVTTMVDRVLDLLQVGVAEYLERKVVGSKLPRSLCVCLVRTVFTSFVHHPTRFLMRCDRCPTLCGYPNFFSESATAVPNFRGRTCHCGRGTIGACEWWLETAGSGLELTCILPQMLQCTLVLKIRCSVVQQVIQL